MERIHARPMAGRTVLVTGATAGGEASSDLTAVPEPAAVVSLLGLSTLSLLRRRRRAFA